MSGPLTTYPRTSGSGGSSLVLFHDLLLQLENATAPDMEKAADDIVQALAALSHRMPDADVVALAVQCRNVLAVAKGKGLVVGKQFLRAMELCAIHWMRLYPGIANTGLAVREQAVFSRHAAASSAAMPAAVRAAVEDAGTVAWLYHVSALLGEDVTATIAYNPAPVLNTRYQVCLTGKVVHYLECGASYNVNQFLRIVLPDPAAPPLILCGEAKGGGSAYGVVRGPWAFMQMHGRTNVPIDQRELLYPLSRAAYMEKANPHSPAGNERRQAGKAITQAGRDGMLVYLAARGTLDTAARAIVGNREVLLC